MFQPPVPLRSKTVACTSFEYLGSHAVAGPDRNFDGDSAGYKDQWAKMKKTVTGIVPTLAENDPSGNDRLGEVEYKSDTEETIREQTSAGNLLFKYDPGAAKTPSEAVKIDWLETWSSTC
jgi:hypothetical protein